MSVATPEFILKLRERIGHDLLWLPGVTAVVLDEASRHLLLTRRADTGDWHLVSGILEPGEQPVAGIRREIAEETGVEVVVEHMSSCWSGDPVVIPTNGDRVQFLDLCFRCRYLAGQAHAADEENLEVAWFRLDDLPQMAQLQHERVRHALAADGAPYLVR